MLFCIYLTCMEMEIEMELVLLAFLFPHSLYVFMIYRYSLSYIPFARSMVSKVVVACFDTEF